MRRGSDYNLICIGSGPAGQRAAIQAAKLGKKVAVIEKKQFAGGVCIETGTIPSKTFREAVRRVYSRPGLELTDPFTHKSRTRPAMQQLIGHVGRVIQREIGIVHDALARNDVALINGRAEFVDSHTVRTDSLTGQRTMTADHFLIAVGTEPSNPRALDPDGQTVFTSDNVLGLAQLPRTMAVVGAGVIGIEYASMFAALGVQVTVIDQRPRPVEFLDHEIVDELIHQLRKSDVTFRCGDAVEHIDIVHTPQRQGLLQLASSKHIVSDVILFSAGRVGATGPLRLDVAGLKADARGRLQVDESYRTSVEHIWAAGDVIGFPALAATSIEQGRLAACHMFGAHSTNSASPLPYGVYTIPEISMIGKTERQLTEEKIPYEVGIARYEELARGQILGDQTGRLKLLFDPRDLKLLGIHIIGEGATELLHIGQAIMNTGATIEYFRDTVFNYPTLAEAYKVAALNGLNKLRN